MKLNDYTLIYDFKKNDFDLKSSKIYINRNLRRRVKDKVFCIMNDNTNTPLGLIEDIRYRKGKLYAKLNVTDRELSNFLKSNKEIFQYQTNIFYYKTFQTKKIAAINYVEILIKEIIQQKISFDSKNNHREENKNRGSILSNTYLSK